LVAEVVVELAGKEILRIPLKGPSMVIGRDPQCDVHLDNRALSRRHAQIEKRGAAIWVRDLNSQNGTYVNGNRIAEPLALNGGDVVEVGRYQVRIEGVDNAREDTPVLTLTGPEGRHRFAMVGDEIIIGRAPSCDIAIGHKSISRRHLRIAIDGSDFIAEDLGSQNGARLNNKRINGPTPFRIGDKLQMSEFTLEVGYLEAVSTDAGSMKPQKTMMIDRSELAKAAYVDGDGFDLMPSNAANISLGKHDANDDDIEESSTRGIAPSGSGEGLPVASSRGANPRPMSRPVTEQPRKPKPPQSPWVTLSHPELGSERDVQLAGDVTCIGEDGTSEDGTKGRAYANQGYVLLVKTANGVVATGAGDRRLITVNGKACLHKQLNAGDTLEYGLLSIVFHLPG
jgi:pSer/pThr/pTyr-binding forkhead associated (FHA) protein